MSWQVHLLNSSWAIRCYLVFAQKEVFLIKVDLCSFRDCVCPKFNKFNENLVILFSQYWTQQLFLLSFLTRLFLKQEHYEFQRNRFYWMPTNPWKFHYFGHPHLGTLMLACNLKIRKFIHGIWLALMLKLKIWLLFAHTCCLFCPSCFNLMPKIIGKRVS